MTKNHWERMVRGLGLAILLMLLLGILGTREPRAWLETARAADLSNDNQENITVVADPEEADAKTIVTVNLNKVKGKLPRTAFGLTFDNWGHDRPDPDFFLRTAEGKAKIKELGAKSFFYSTDRDNWQAPYDSYTAFPRNPPSSVVLTDEFLATSATVGADPIFAVNVTNLCKPRDASQPPSSANVSCKMASPKMAAKWLKYSQSLNSKKVKYVAMGIEPYVGCRYWVKGINCTVQFGEHKIILPQAEYAARVVKWAIALKKADPKIKIGVHLQPNTFVCKGAKSSNAIDTSDDNEDAPYDESAVQEDEDFDTSSPEAASKCGGVSWDETVLKAAAPYIDFVMVHQYFVLTQPVTTKKAAQQYSYYQEQRDVRLNKQGVTAMPSQIRKELKQWLPKKLNIPIVVSEFNASGLSKQKDDVLFQNRQTLSTGLAVGELWLDLISPVKNSGKTLKGADRTILLGMFTPQLTIARFPPSTTAPADMIYMPSWHVLTMLKPFAGKTLVAVSAKNNPKTRVNKRPALRMYAVKKGTDVYVAVFNHNSLGIKSRIVLNGLKPTAADVTQLGQNAGSFLAQNSPANPTAITPLTVPIPLALLTDTGIQRYTFAPHSLTVFHITGQ